MDPPGRCGFQIHGERGEQPIKISFSFKAQDGYFPPSDDTQFAWGIKLAPEQVATFKGKRPDLFTPDGKVDYPAVTMGFVIFSSICPHLGCRFEWKSEDHRFICPCHGSQFGVQGDYQAGPAPRGLDPLPFREKNGVAEVTWIQYKQQQPSRVVISYT
jgi:Rieske Fe-S protein